ncbi:hypothetical protein [Xenorhabdus griffiniae]|nr:hypothetical protein [Xenorhabdus griffiniae]MDC9604070.1 hypothetical protein [Xenorhabdus griffiniae]
MKKEEGKVVTELVYPVFLGGVTWIFYQVTPPPCLNKSKSF